MSELPRLSARSCVAGWHMRHRRTSSRQRRWKVAAQLRGWMLEDK